MQFFFNPTGNLYKDKKSSSLAKTYQLETCKTNEILRQTNIIPLKLLKPDCGWLESNEPKDHLDKLSIALKKSFIKIKTFLYFSNKDFSLANRLNEKDTNVDILFSNYNSKKNWVKINFV